MKHQFLALDAIRGIAALLVLVRHSESFWTFTLFRNYLAVDLFFFLSGFVIAHSYEARLQSQRLSGRQFVLIRAIRLYPLYAMSLLLAISLRADWQSPLRVAQAALMIPSFGQGRLFPLDVTYWSLFFEIVVNLVYVGTRRWLTDRALRAVVLLSGAALAPAALLYGGLNLGAAGVAYHFFPGLLRAVFGIAFGLLLYRHRLGLTARLPAGFGPAAAILSIIVVLCSPSLRSTKLDGLAECVVVWFVFPACVLAAARAPIARGMRAAAWLGAASYPVYLLHPLVNDLCVRFVPGIVADHAPFSGMVYVAVVLVLSVAIERLLDLPVRRWLTSRLIPPRAAAGSAAAVPAPLDNL